jgi:ankyrin repeat protein
MNLFTGFGTYKEQLHEALKKTPFNVEEFERLLERLMTFIDEKDSKNRTLLHIAAANESIDHQFMENLIKLNPSALFVIDNSGKLPLHYAAERSLGSYDDLEVIHTLINTAKWIAKSTSTSTTTSLPCSGIYEEDDQQNTPLDYFIAKSPLGHMKTISALSESDLHLFRSVLSHNPTCSFLAEVINEKPSLLKTEFDDKQHGKGNNAVHFAVAHDLISYQTMDYLIHCHEDALKMKNHIGQLPLHIACMYPTTSLSILKLLLLLYPDAVKVIDSEGNLPVDYAILHHLSLEVIQALTAMYATLHFTSIPAQITVKLAQDCYHPTTLLEVLTTYSSSATLQDRLVNAMSSISMHERILQTIERYPNCCHAYDSHQRTPLHLAIQLRLPLETIRVILKGNPDACRFKDSKHCLPIHLIAGLAGELPFEMMEDVVTAYPLGLKIQDGDGLLPFHLALSHYASIEWMEHILALHLHYCHALDERLTLLEELFRHSMLNNPYSVSCFSVIFLNVSTTCSLVIFLFLFFFYFAENAGIFI